jgi:hypothetical protein
MANIQKRGNRWLARYRDDTGREHGQRFDRKIDAQRWLDAQTTALVTGQYCDPRAGKITLRKYGEEWQATAPHGPTTRDLVSRSLERHIYPVLDDLPMRAIRTTQIQALVTTMGIVLAPSTVRDKYSYLVSIMHAAVRDKVIASSPCEGVRLPEVRKKEVQIPSLAVLDATLDTYAHVSPDADDRTRDAVQDALASKIDDAADNLRTGDGSYNVYAAQKEWMVLIQQCTNYR